MADVSDTFESQRQGDKAARVAAYLHLAIRRGRFAPGQRLVETDITDELGVSRGPVREAFRRLSAEGLIEIVPHRGAVVRRLSATEAIELFQIRTELEALAARQAVDRVADPCVRDRFDAAITPIRATQPRYSTSDYIVENRNFHAAIFTAAGNRQLVALNEKLQLSLIMAQIATALTSDVIAASLAEHRTIADAILSADATAADRAVRDHLERAMNFMRSMPADVFRRDCPPA